MNARTKRKQILEELRGINPDQRIAYSILKLAREQEEHNKLLTKLMSKRR